MAKYGKKAQDKVEKAMHERKNGTLKSGSSGKKVKSRKQAIAIGLSEARAQAAKCRTQEVVVEEGVVEEAFVEEVSAPAVIHQKRAVGSAQCAEASWKICALRAANCPLTSARCALPHCALIRRTMTPCSRASSSPRTSRSSSGRPSGRTTTSPG